MLHKLVGNASWNFHVVCYSFGKKRVVTSSGELSEWLWTIPAHYVCQRGNEADDLMIFNRQFEDVSREQWKIEVGGVRQGVIVGPSISIRPNLLQLQIELQLFPGAAYPT